MPMTDLTALKAALEAAGLKPNRALGQNFFVDGARLDAIVDAAGIDGRAVLEIGPGMGALTERLAERAARVVAVEKDAAMAALLRERLSGAANLTVETADILRFPIAEAMQKGVGEDFSVVGNLPYYITTPIAERLLQLLPASMTLMVQREAAERFFAGPDDRVYGPLAAMTAVCCEARRVMEVPRGCYYPQPDVDSTVVHLVRRDAADGIPAEAFFAFLNRAFSMRRKTLFNNLGREPRVEQALASLGLPENVRAEALPPKQLYEVFRLCRLPARPEGTAWR